MPVSRTSKRSASAPGERRTTISISPRSVNLIALLR
jgi:hypothetical protein